MFITTIILILTFLSHAGFGFYCIYYRPHWEPMAYKLFQIHGTILVIFILTALSIQVLN